MRNVKQVSGVISLIISCVGGKVFEKVLSKTFRETIPRSKLGNFRKFDRQNFTVTAEFISTLNKCT